MTRRDKIEGWTAATILIVGIPALMFASQRMAIGFFSMRQDATQTREQRIAWDILRNSATGRTAAALGGRLWPLQLVGTIIDANVPATTPRNRPPLFPAPIG